MMALVSVSLFFFFIFFVSGPFDTIIGAGRQKCPTSYIFSYIFQRTCRIILKFSLSNSLSILLQKIKSMKILLFLYSIDDAHIVER